MTSSNIIIFDTTLRDGEQAPGATMSESQKMAIATALDHMGVDVIEAGFAAASQGDFQCIEAIAKQVKNASVCSLARAKNLDIEAAGLAVKKAVKPRIHTFISTSDIHLQHQFRMTRETALEVISRSVSYARNLCQDVEWSAMDATRSDMDFLAKAVEVAIKAGATIINLPDTVGYSLPHEYGKMIHTLKEKVVALNKVIISVHCHNDLGLAVANTLAAVQMGARQVECTINGIGERAGNAALEEIVLAIKTRNDALDFSTNIKTTHIADISRLVSDITGFVVQKNKAIVGENAFAHESGIHQDGMLKCRNTYEIMTPESVGIKKTELVMGKHSGRAAFKHKVNALNIVADDDLIEATFKQFKALGDQKKQITDDDIVRLFKGSSEQNVADNHPRFIWMNGEFIAWDEAQCHVLSHGLHYASCVFEGERAYEGEVFKLDEHTQRLHESAKMLGFTIPYSVKEIETITYQLLNKNNLKNAYIRPIAWCGPETLSVSSRGCKVHVAIAAWEWGCYFSDHKISEKGLKLNWAEWMRPSPATAPVKAKAAGLYVIGTLSKNKAEQAGFNDALMLDHRGYIAECTGANFFMVKKGVIHTPIADCFLDGITRQTIIQLAKDQYIPIVERHILPEEIGDADEIFITGTAVEVGPVVQVGNQAFNIGPITKEILKIYQSIVRQKNANTV